MRAYYRRMFVGFNLRMLVFLLICESSFVVLWIENEISTIVLILVSLLILAAMGIFLKRIVVVDALENIREYCRINKIEMEQLESDFRTSKRFGRHIRKSEQWMYFMNDKSWPDIIKISDITYIEYKTYIYMRRRHKYMYVYDRKNEITKIPMNKRTFRKLQKEQIC